MQLDTPMGGDISVSPHFSFALSASGPSTNKKRKVVFFNNFLFSTLQSVTAGASIKSKRLIIVLIAA